MKTGLSDPRRGPRHEPMAPTCGQMRHFNPIRNPPRSRGKPSLPKRRSDDHPHATSHPGRERVCGTLGRHRAPRPPRPHPHLEPPPTRTAPTQVHRALQHASAPPKPRATRTQRSRRRRASDRPADPMTPHLRRTHQRVPPGSLNHPDNDQSTTNTPIQRVRSPATRSVRAPTVPHRSPNRVSGTHGTTSNSASGPERAKRRPAWSAPAARGMSESRGTARRCRARSPL